MTPATFNFGPRTVRVITRNGEPWFVGIDVARVLGYAAPRNAIANHCKGALKQCLPSQSGEQEFSIIPEADLYRLILRSKAPHAEQFQDWVCTEVLPTIRKTGSYQVPSAQTGPFGHPPITPEQRLEEALLVYLRETRPACEFMAVDKKGRPRDKFRRPTFTVNGRKDRAALRVNAAMLMLDSYLTPLLPGFADDGIMPMPLSNHTPAPTRSKHHTKNPGGLLGALRQAPKGSL